MGGYIRFNTGDSSVSWAEAEQLFATALAKGGPAAVNYLQWANGISWFCYNPAWEETAFSSRSAVQISGLSMQYSPLDGTTQQSLVLSPTDPNPTVTFEQYILINNADFNYIPPRLLFLPIPTIIKRIMPSGN